MPPRAPPFRRRFRADIASDAIATTAPVRADVSTHYERCREDDFSADDIAPGGGWASVKIYYGGRSVGEKNQTACGGPVAAYEIIRTGEERFRIDCYDDAGLAAIETKVAI